MQNPELVSELSHILANLPYSSDIYSDSWRIREILAGLGVLSNTNEEKNWPKPLSLDELAEKIGQKVYILNTKNPKYDIFDRVESVCKDKNSFRLEYSSRKDGYGTV